MKIGDAELVHSQTWNDSKTPKKIVRNSEFSERVDVDHPPEDEQQSAVGHARVRYVEHAKSRTKRM